MTDSNLNRLRQLISAQYPDSQLEPISDHHLQSLQNTYPNVPAHLVAFYRHIGCGGIGRGRYMIHFATEPSEIYDEQTAADLGNVLIVGDNYAGDCDGYNVDHDWAFGAIDSCGSFVSAETEFPTILERLLYILGDE